MGMISLLDGRTLAHTIQAKLKNQVRKLPAPPCLGVLLVGDDPASRLYVHLKKQAAAEVGITVRETLLPEAASSDDVLAAVRAYNADKNIHGILVQLPLPAHISRDEVIAALAPQKDADGFHPQTLQALATDHPTIIPGLARGIFMLIEQSGIALAGKHMLVLAKSSVFAEPLKLLGARYGIQVTHQIAADPDLISQADIVIVALGQPQALTCAHFKDGAVAIDVGTTKIGTRVVGDVALGDTKGKQLFLSPVPGGVGPLTVAMLLQNVYEIAAKQHSSSQ